MRITEEYIIPISRVPTGFINLLKIIKNVKKRDVFSIDKKTYNKFKDYYKNIINNSKKCSGKGIGGGTRYKINSGFFKKYMLAFVNCATFVYAAFYYCMPFKMTAITAFFKTYPNSPTIVFNELHLLKIANRM